MALTRVTNNIINNVAGSKLTGNILSSQVSGALTTDNMAPGSIVQVKHKQLRESFNTGGTQQSFGSRIILTNLNITLTPYFSNSLIVICGGLALGAMADSNNAGVCIWIERDGTNLNSGGANGCASFYHDSSHTRDYYGNMMGWANEISGSTASRTYKISIGGWNAVGARVGNHDGQNSLTVWEIRQ